MSFLYSSVQNRHIIIAVKKDKYEAMGTEIVTKEDLEAFRILLIQDIERLFTSRLAPAVKPWLKGTEVRKLLSISAGTLQTLRVTGKLKSSKIGGTHYYRYEDIKKMMNEGI